MKHTIKNSSETERQIIATLQADDFTPIKQRTLAKLAKKVKVPGFRPGKVPANIAERHIDSNILNSELLEDAVNFSLIDILDEIKITPLDQPKIEIKKYVPGQELEYQAVFEVIPEIKLGDYKKLKVKKQEVKVAEQEISDAIDRIARGMSTKSDVDRTAKSGDELLIDFVGTDEKGKEVAGATGKNYPLTLGSGTFIPGFEDGLVGKKAGDKVTLELTFPKDYHHKPLASAKVKFDVTVHGVKEISLPAIDDEFAAKCGPFKNVAELKADVERELNAQKEREVGDKLRDDLLEQLVKGSTIPTPEVLVNDQIESIERDFVQNLLYRGLTLDQYLEQQGTTKDDWRKKELRTQATRRVQVGLALSELSKLEDIKLAKDELDAKLQEFLAYYNDPEMRKQLDTPEARRDIANRLLTEKTLDCLVELNT